MFPIRPVPDNDVKKPAMFVFKDMEDVINEISYTSMLRFCQYLYDDISQNIDEWVSFVDYQDIDIAKRKEDLEQKLKRLKELITEKEVNFSKNRCFL